MREITDAEMETLLQRNRELTDFIEEALDDPVELLENLGFPEPEKVLDDSDRFLEPLAGWLDRQSIDQKHFDAIGARMGFFIGDLFAQRYEGEWYVDDDPGSPYVLHYVVGNFRRVRRPKREFPPFGTAYNYLIEPPGRRSLVEVANRIDRELRQ